MRKAVKGIIRLVRRLLGIEQLANRQKQLIKELKNQRHQLDRALSYFEFATIDDVRLKKSDKYRNFHDIILPLIPMDIAGAKYRRVGRANDGGYVMLDDLVPQNIDAAYSFGINDDVSWDEAIAELGIEVYMYDHTIKRLPKRNPRFHFFKVGVTGDPAEKGLQTLGNLVVKNGHQNSKNLILKMDIEGYEWSVFEETSSEVIGLFSQIVIELHGLNPSSSKADLSKVLSVLNKINQTHQSIHIHGNGHCSISWLGELALPHVLEVTYIRRSDYADRLIENTRTFPTEIDQPTFPWLSDVPLRAFTAEMKESLRPSRD